MKLDSIQPILWQFLYKFLATDFSVGLRLKWHNLTHHAENHSSGKKNLSECRGFRHSEPLGTFFQSSKRKSMLLENVVNLTLTESLIVVVPFGLLSRYQGTGFLGSKLQNGGKLTREGYNELGKYSKVSLLSWDS